MASHATVLKNPMKHLHMLDNNHEIFMHGGSLPSSVFGQMNSNKQNRFISIWESFETNSQLTIAKHKIRLRLKKMNKYMSHVKHLTGKKENGPRDVHHILHKLWNMALL